MDNEAIFGAEFDLSSEDESTDKDQRTFQSEEDFQRQKQSWTPKIENRQELLRFVDIEPESKFHVLGMKSVAELLYFERRYKLALEVGERVLNVEHGEKGIGASDRNEVEDLVERCRQRLVKST